MYTVTIMWSLNKHGASWASKNNWNFFWGEFFWNTISTGMYEMRIQLYSNFENYDIAWIESIFENLYDI